MEQMNNKQQFAEDYGKTWLGSDIAWAAAQSGFIAGWDACQQNLQQTPCTTPLLAEITRCRSEAEKKKTEWSNGMSEHAIEARAMIMLCNHLLGFNQ